MTDALIHLRVPAATKGRWVRASRAGGMRLTDWVVDAVEAYMQQQMAKVATTTVTFKIGFGGYCSLAHPKAEPGEKPSGNIIWAVDDVPADVQLYEVLRLFRDTAIWRPGQYRVRYDELGVGKILT